MLIQHFVHNGNVVPWEQPEQKHVHVHRLFSGAKTEGASLFFSSKDNTRSFLLFRVLRLIFVAQWWRHALFHAL